MIPAETTPGVVLRITVLGGVDGAWIAPRIFTAIVAIHWHSNKYWEPVSLAIPGTRQSKQSPHRVGAVSMASPIRRSRSPLCDTHIPVDADLDSPRTTGQMFRSEKVVISERHGVTEPLYIKQLGDRMFSSWGTVRAVCLRRRRTARRLECCGFVLDPCPQEADGSLW